MDLDTLAHSLTKELYEFDYTLSGSDHVWQILFPDRQGKWNQLHINRYRETFYMAHINGERDTLAVEPKGSVSVVDLMSDRSIPWEQANDDIEGLWTPLLTSVRRWLGRAKKNWVQAAKRVQAEYPLQYRRGTVPANASPPSRTSSMSCTTIHWAATSLGSPRLSRGSPCRF